MGGLSARSLLAHSAHGDAAVRMQLCTASGTNELHAAFLKHVSVLAVMKGVPASVLAKRETDF